jgi:single-strand DNA-binding protein
MNLNKVFIIGRLASDPESRTTPGGQVVTTLRVATNRVWNDRGGQKQEQVEFHTIVAWGGLGDIASKYLRKGQMALFEGRMQTRSWQGPDGLKRYRTEIVAENMQLGPKAAGTASERYTPPSPNRQPQESRPMSEDEIPVINEDAPVTSDPIISDKEVEETEIDLKDIPF